MPGLTDCPPPPPPKADDVIPEFEDLLWCPSMESRSNARAGAGGGGEAGSGAKVSVIGGRCTLLEDVGPECLDWGKTAT